MDEIILTIKGDTIPQRIILKIVRDIEDICKDAIPPGTDYGISLHHQSETILDSVMAKNISEKKEEESVENPLP